MCLFALLAQLVGEHRTRVGGSLGCQTSTAVRPVGLSDQHSSVGLATGEQGQRLQLRDGSRVSALELPGVQAGQEHLVSGK